jgi:hypothetical protein
MTQPKSKKKSGPPPKRTGKRGVERYVEVRDKRMSLTEAEVDLNAELLALLKKNGKTSYHRDGIDIKIVVEKEKVKVKVKKDDEGAGER